MKKLFTLFTAVMLVFALGANAQSRKTWDFTKGVSAATRVALDADLATWDKKVNVDTGESTAWTSKVNFNGELTAGGAVIPEFAGLAFSNFGATNAVLYRITTLRLSKKAKITLPALRAGQKIAISAQSANSTATDRGFVFTNAVNENSESTILVPGPDGAVTINLTVVADGVVDIETGVTGAKEGVEINSIIIDEGDKNIKKWDFSAWSEATKAQVTTAEDWTKAESATKEYITGDEIRWCLTPTSDANGDLVAGGAAIAEMKGLRHTGLAAYSYGMAFDYKQTLDDNNWGPYNGGSYLWVMGAATSITVPNVKAGSTFKLGVETHKLIPAGTSDARGFKVTVNGTEVGATQTATDYKEFEYTIPAGADEYVDVVVTATKGCHLYFIEAEVKDETVVDKNPNLGAPTYSIKNGAKINPATATGFTVKFPKVANLPEDQVIQIEGYCGPAVIEEGDDASNYLFDGIEGSPYDGVVFTYTDFEGLKLKENTEYQFYLTKIIVPNYDALNVTAAEGEKLYELSFETTGPGINVERSWQFTTDVAMAEAIAKSIDDGLGYWNDSSYGRYSVSTNMFNDGNQQLLMGQDTPLTMTDGLFFTMANNNDILIGTPTHMGPGGVEKAGQNNGKLQLGGGSPELIIPQCNGGDEVTVKALWSTKNKGKITITNGTAEDGTNEITLTGSAAYYKIKVSDNGDLVLKSSNTSYNAISVFPSTIEKKEIEYTVNLVEGENNVIKAAVATGKAETNDNISVPYSYWVTDAEGNVYTKGTKGTPFTESFVIENEKTDYNLVYNTTAYGKAAYCMEGEDIEGALACTHGNTVIRSSGTKAAYNDQDITLTTLQPGSYKIRAILFAGDKNGTYNATFTVGTKNVVMNAPEDNWNEVESEDLIEVTEATPLVWNAGGDENHGLDIIMVYESEDIPDGVNGVAENGSVSAKTVKVVKDGRVVIESANGTYTVAGAQMK